MKTKPTFSIIIPTLNEEATIGSLLTALKNQTFKPHEVIVVDGKSEDDTQSVVKKMGATLLEAAQRGVGNQRTVGGKKATGDWLVFLDADSYVEPNFLENLKDHISSSAHGMILPHYLPQEKSLHFSFMFWMLNFGYWVLHRFKPALPGMGMAYRRDIFSKVGSFKDGFIGEDLDFSLRASEFTKLLKVAVPVFVSVRRFKKDGLFVSSWKYIATLWYFLLGRIDSSSKFEYKFGHYSQKK